MKTLQFIWIDDNTEKIKNFRAPIENGGAEFKAKAAIHPLKVEKNFLETLTTWVEANKNKPPDLFIIDQVYNLALPFGLTGSSIAHILRGTFAAVPAVCVTAKLDDQTIVDKDDLSEYVTTFAYTQLEKYVVDFYAIARDFKKLFPRKNADTRQHLVASLRPPRRDRGDLLRLLPEEFQERGPIKTAHRIAYWVYNVLRERPGFLYDRLYAATLLGLNEKGFEVVEDRFSGALYKGSMAIPSKPRWWASELRRILYSLIPADAPDIPQLAGRILQGVDKAHFSSCHVSKKSEPPPDVVAFIDATYGAQRVVTQKEFTEQHPRDAGLMPGFETQLVLRRRKNS